MPRPAVEVAEVFRRHGPSYRQRHRRRMTATMVRVMRAVELCRTAALGGHVWKCDRCGREDQSHNSCRNRHCPKCQSTARARWLEARREELLPVTYFHVVFTLPDALSAVALHNKRVVYDLLFRAVSRTLLTIGRDPKHLGADLGFFAVLHTWGQQLQHHPHLHCVVPGGGLAPDRSHWIRRRPVRHRRRPRRRPFLLPVRVLSRLYRRLFLTGLQEAFDDGRLRFPGAIAPLDNREAFAALIRRLRANDWVVYAKRPFGGPDKVLDYLSRYTHRVAISNHRLLSMRDGKVTFRWHDYRTGTTRAMTLTAEEFIRRFLLHVLPDRFVRIRHFGLFANRHRTANLARCRQLLNVKVPTESTTDAPPPPSCPRCRVGRLYIVATIARNPDPLTHQERPPP